MKASRIYWLCTWFKLSGRILFSFLSWWRTLSGNIWTDISMLSPWRAESLLFWCCTALSGWPILPVSPCSTNRDSERGMWCFLLSWSSRVHHTRNYSLWEGWEEQSTLGCCRTVLWFLSEDDTYRNSLFEKNLSWEWFNSGSSQFIFLQGKYWLSQKKLNACTWYL